MDYARFSFPTTIHFGIGVRFRLAEVLAELRLKRPLIVTDKNVRLLKIFSDFSEFLKGRDFQVAAFAEISGNPIESQVTQGTLAFHTHQADCIIGLGGGAALDVAKAIALMAYHPGSLFDYEDGIANAKPIEGPIPPWFGIPTTAGTGSEVGRSTVISDEKTHVKKVIFSPRLLAHQVFADPETTYDLPPFLTAATGMDALTHCIEAYLAKDYHPICDGIALEGIRLLSDSLQSATRDPLSKEARTSLLMASMMGAIAFQKGLGVTHSCAHALSTLLDLHHGLANGIMIDHALQINREVAASRFQILGAILNLAPGEDLLSWLKDLKQRVGMPAGLSCYRLSPQQIQTLSDLASQDGCHLNNPRPCTTDDFVQIFNQAVQC